MDGQVNDLFEALYALTDFRVLLRETAPLHSFNEEQRIKARDAIARAKEAVLRLEGVFGDEDRR